MTVFKNRQRRNEWRYDFRLDGRRYFGACIMQGGKPAANKREALDAEAAMRNAVRGAARTTRTVARAGTYTFGQAIIARLNRKVRGSDLHKANLRLYGRELLAFFGDMTPIASITQADIDAYRAKAAEMPVAVWRGGPRRREKMPAKLGTGSRKRSPASINHRLNFLRAVLRQAHQTRDPVADRPLLKYPPLVERVPQPKRQPRPMPDTEFYARIDTAPPWVRETAELVRYFGLRRAEALGVDLGHIDCDRKAIRFDGDHTKSGRDEFAYPLPGGWPFLLRLAKQAKERGQTRLITWPGPGLMRDFLAGGDVPKDAWRPIKSIGTAWRATAGKAQIGRPHRLHDIRARYITDVAKVARGVAKEAARHADPATTERYIAFETSDVAEALRGAARPQRPALRSVRGGKA
jgi:integrase